MQITIYLSGEIHSDWCEQMIKGIQDQDLSNTLKEVDASAMAVAETSGQVVEILKYITTKE